MDKGLLITNAIKDNLRCGINASTENKIHFVLLLEILNSVSSHLLLLFYLARALFTIKNFLASSILWRRQQTASTKETQSLHILFGKTTLIPIFIQKETWAWPAHTDRPHCTACLLFMQHLHLNPYHSCIYFLDLLETKLLCCTSYPRISCQPWLKLHSFNFKEYNGIQ